MIDMVCIYLYVYMLQRNMAKKKKQPGPYQTRTKWWEEKLMGLLMQVAKKEIVFEGDKSV